MIGIKDYSIRAIDEKKNIRVFIASTTHLVEKARQIHNTTPVATVALGRILTGSSMMGLMMKNKKDKLTLNVKGNGPLGSILAVANSYGMVKGYVSNPHVDLPLRQDGKLDVGRAVGKKGRLIIIRDLGLKEPYIGQSNLVTGEIGEDLAHYFVTSEQQPSAVALGVLVDKDLSVKAAGGFILQVLPNIKDYELKKLEEKINTIHSISRLIDQGYTPENTLEALFADFNMTIKDKEEIKYECDCSQERLQEVLRSLGKKELRTIIEEDEKAEIVCQFCNIRYNFSKNELISILEEKG